MKSLHLWKNRIISLCLAVGILLAVLPLAAAAEGGGSTDPLRYGRQVLAQQANAEGLLYAYDQLVDGIADLQESVSIYDDAHRVTVEEVQTAFAAVRSDHPELFWLDSGYGYSSDGTYVRAVVPQYTVADAAALAEEKAAVEKQVKALLFGLAGQSDYQIALQLHDRLTAHVSYVFGNHHQTVYGALVDREAVCNGYAAAYQYLLQRAGIPAWKVTGNSVNPTTGERVSHAWNMVCLDGAWYHSDPTWDDQDATGYPFYGYMNVTTAQIAEEHEMDAFFAAGAPVCTATQANYYTVNGGKMAAFDAEAVTAAMGDGSAARVYVTGDVDAFVTAWGEQVVSVAQKLGVSGGFSYGYAVVGHEVLLKILTQNTVTGTVTAKGAAGDMTVELWARGSAEPVYATTLAGAADGAVYTLAGVTSGQYTLRVLKDGHAVSKQPVTVGIRNIAQNVRLWLLGDVTGDETLDGEDALYTLYSLLLPQVYASNQSVDFDGDGIAAEQDAVYLLYHVSLPDEYPLA